MAEEEKKEEVKETEVKADVKDNAEVKVEGESQKKEEKKENAEGPEKEAEKKAPDSPKEQEKKPAADEKKEPEKVEEGEKAPEGTTKKKKISKMTLIEVDSKLKSVKEKMGGVESDYAKQLLLRKDELSS